EVRAISSAARGIEKERHLRSFVLPGAVHQSPVPSMKLPVEIAEQHLRWLRVRCYRPDMCGKVALLLLSCNGARLSQHIQLLVSPLADRFYVIRMNRTNRQHFVKNAFC